MLVQFEVDNSDGLLKPGGFAQVSMGLPGQPRCCGCRPAR